jgi:hypothetical protein
MYLSQPKYRQRYCEFWELSVVAEVQAGSAGTRHFLTHAKIRAVDFVEVVQTDLGVGAGPSCRRPHGEGPVADLANEQHAKTVTADPAEVVEADLVGMRLVVNLAAEQYTKTMAIDPGEVVETDPGDVDLVGMGPVVDLIEELNTAHPCRCRCHSHPNGTLVGCRP